MSRKEKLEVRANRYGKGQVPYGPDWAHFATGYEDGYRAAMRDLRKLVRQCEQENKWHPVHDAVRRMNHISHCVRVRVQQFLRPLR